MTLVHWILLATPLGVFVLILGVLLQTGAGALQLIGVYIVGTAVLMILFTLVLYPVTALAGGVSMRRFARGFLFDGVFGGFSVEAGEMGQQLVAGNPTGLLKSGSLFMAADTPIGPVYLAYGRAQAGVSSYYVYLGKPF